MMGSVSLNARVGRPALVLLDHQMKRGGMLKELLLPFKSAMNQKELKFAWQFNDFREMYGKLVSKEGEAQSLTSWRGITPVITPPIAALINDKATPEPVKKTYEKLSAYLNGVYSIAFLSMLTGEDQHALHFEFHNLKVFELLPSKEVIAQLKEEEKPPKTKQPLGTYNPSGCERTEYKIVVFGGQGVGKSACTVQYIQNVFVEHYDPTIEDSYRKQAYIDGEYVLLEILDTTNDYNYSAMRDLYMRNADGFILLYSITDSRSLQELEDIKDQILRVKDADMWPMVVAGNKADLNDSRTVTRSDAVTFASRANARHMEVSAKTRTNIDELFHELVRSIKANSNSIF